MKIVPNHTRFCTCKYAHKNYHCHVLFFSILQLKAYAKFQGIPTDYNTNAAGFALEKDKVTASSDSTILSLSVATSYFSNGNCLIYLSLFIFRYEILDELPKVKEYKLILFLIAVFDVCVALSEFIQLIIVARYSFTVAVGVFAGKIFWMIIPPIVFALQCLLLCQKCLSSKLPCIKLLQLHITFFFGQLLFSSLLPTFLLLLVYPMKVIFLFAYFVTFIYSFVYFIVALKSTQYEKGGCGLTCSVGLFLLYYAGFLFIMLFLLIITEAAVFAPGVYGVIPFLPPVFITSATWILKRKVVNKAEYQGYQRIPSREQTNVPTSE